MKRNDFKVLLAVSLGAIASVASAFTSEVINGRRLTVVDPGETLEVGGAGSDTYNTQGGVIVLQEGSVLKVSQTAARTVWSTIVATNGAARLEFLKGSSYPQFSSHILARDKGSLTIAGVNYVNLGHSLNLPYYDIPNLSLADTSGDGVKISHCTLRRLPASAKFVLEDNIRLIGRSDMFPSKAEVTLTTGRIYLSQPTAIPPEKTIRVVSPAVLAVRPVDVVETGDAFADFPQTLRWSYPADQVFSNTVALADGATLELNPTEKAFGWDGTVTGSGAAVLGSTCTIGKTSAFADDGVELQVAANGKLKVAAGIPAATFHAVRGLDGTSAVLAPAGQEVTIENPRGTLVLSGAGREAGSVIRLSALTPGAAVADDETAVIDYAGSSKPPASCPQIASADGRQLLTVFSDGNVDVASFVGLLTGFPTFSAIDVHGTSTFSGLDASLTVRGAAGSQTTVLADSGSVSVAGEGEFSLRRTEDWRKAVTLWFDFSKTNTVRHVGEGTGQAGYADKKMGSRYYIEQVLDAQSGDSSYTLFNRRLVNQGKVEFFDWVYCNWGAETGVLNDLAYVDFGPFPGYGSNARRLPLAKGDTEYLSGMGNFADVPHVRQAVLVFGSGKGGGAALLSTANGALGRAGTTVADGITTNGAARVWVDGTNVVPTAANALNGKWQVITIALDDIAFNGIGWAQKNAGVLGGQQYGEILLFEQELPEVERLMVEEYLAEKWGLSAQYAPAAKARLRELQTAYVTGSGQATVRTDGRDVVLDGAFAGTIALNGGALTVKAGSLPWSEADIPSEGRIFWMDPDDESSVYTRQQLSKEPLAEYQRDELIAVHDHALGAFQIGVPFVGGTVARAPRLERAARGLGPERTWIDYNQPYFQTGSGNNLRFYDYVEGTRVTVDGVQNTSEATLSVRTAFYVQDSCRGGGSAAMNEVGGGGNVLPIRNNAYTSPIWSNNATTEVREGANRVNGAAVAVKDGWTGLPEVFSFRTKTAGVNAKFLAAYTDTENIAPAEQKGRIQGESLWYSTALDDATMLGIESYLMNKWLGRLPEGYVDVRAATVTGSGSVSAPTAAQLPKIGADFSGTVTAGTGDFTMTIDPETDSVEGAIVAPGVTLAVPAARSVTVSFASRVHGRSQPHVYKLFDVAGFSPDGEWTVTLTGDNVPEGAEIVRQGGVIAVSVPPRGLIFIVR